tara:strand:+ start:967 stop:1080 length:114 start_codon:yes stop_codon:yes gene_type:complete
MKNLKLLKEYYFSLSKKSKMITGLTVIIVLIILLEVL